MIEIVQYRKKGEETYVTPEMLAPFVTRVDKRPNPECPWSDPLDKVWSVGGKFYLEAECMHGFTRRLQFGDYVMFEPPGEDADVILRDAYAGVLEKLSASLNRMIKKKRVPRLRPKLWGIIPIGRKTMKVRHLTLVKG